MLGQSTLGVYHFSTEAVPALELHATVHCTLYIVYNDVSGNLFLAPCNHGWFMEYELQLLANYYGLAFKCHFEPLLGWPLLYHNLHTHTMFGDI
jgi:hypothetical protein